MIYYAILVIFKAIFTFHLDFYIPLSCLLQGALYGMAQSIPDRTIINQIAIGYLDAYYSTVKLPPLPNEEADDGKEISRQEDAKTAASKNGSIRKRGVKNGNVKH